MRAVSMLILLALCSGVRAQNGTPEQLFQTAWEAQQKGDIDRAVALYRKLLEISPNLVSARANLGAALSKLGRFDEAIQQYRKALAQEPGNKALRLNLALAYFKKPDWKAAGAELSSLHEADRGNAQVSILLGNCLLQLKKFGEAIAVLEPLEKTDPENLDLEYVLGSAMIRSGQWREGLSRIQKVADTGHSAEAYMLAGETLLRLVEFQKAGTDIEAAERLNPNLPGLTTVRGMLLEKNGDFKTATVLLEKALKENTDDFQAHLHLGAIQYIERDLIAARRHLSRALQLDPASALAQYEMALVERASGNLDPAVKYLERLVKDNPKWLQPHIELSALYYRLHRSEDGAKEREVVTRLSAAEDRQEMESLGAIEKAPSQ